MTKQQTRRAMLLGLRALPADEIREGSAGIRRHLASAPQFTEAGVILLFAALPTEPELLNLIAEHGTTTHRFALPRVRESHGDLELREVRSVDHELRPGAFGIREPDPTRCPTIAIDAVDLAIVPGLAFTATGARLGRGGGFYDRLLSHPDWRAQSIGVAFPRQILETLPLEPHDQCVHRVLTSHGWQNP